MAGMQITIDVQKVDAVFFMYCATLVFAMQIGFALLEVGSVSIRNTKNILVKNVVDLCASGLAYFLFGYGLAWGSSESGFAGRDGYALQQWQFSAEHMATAASAHSDAFFSACFAATSATIVSGAVAERFPFQSYAVVSTAGGGRDLSRRLALGVVREWLGKSSQGGWKGVI